MQDDGKVIIGTELDTKRFDKQIEEVEYELRQIEVELRQKKELKLDSRTIKDMEIQAEKLGNKLIDLRKKQEDLTKSNLGGIPGIIGNIGQSMEGIIKKVGRWSLAIFGIRSAYMMIRQAINTLASEDDQIAYDIEYVKWILAQTLKPLVEWIIKGLYFIIALINSISKEILGINILAGKSAEAFKNAKKNTSGMSKDLKEAKKQLAGFDEMNVSQDSSSGGGGIDNWTPPDLEGYGGEVKKVKTWWDKLLEDMNNTLNAPPEVWSGAFGNWAMFVHGITEFFYGLLEVVDGVLTTIGGLFKALWGLITGDSEKASQGLEQIWEGLTKIIGGLLDMVVGLIQTVVGLILGLVLDLVDGIVKFVKWCWDTDVKIISGIAKWVDDNVIKPLINFFAKLWLDMTNGFNKVINWIVDKFNSFVSFINGIINMIVSSFRAMGNKAGDVFGGAFKGVINGVLGAIEGILNFPIKAINKLIKTVNKIPGVNLGNLSTFSLPRLAKGGIINMPGRGVPVGSAIAGERGVEGVIPLTDSQQMDLLGASIGKHITINANITTTMNGRVISKELQKIQAENDFAYNR